MTHADWYHLITLISLSMTLQTNHVESSDTAELPARTLFYSLQLWFQRKSSALSLKCVADQRPPRFKTNSSPGPSWMSLHIDPHRQRHKELGGLGDSKHRSGCGREMDEQTSRGGGDGWGLLGEIRLHCLAELIHGLCKVGLGRLRRGEEEFPFFTVVRSPPLLPSVLPFSDLSDTQPARKTVSQHGNLL